MREATFNTEVKKSLIDFGYPFVYKPPDMPRFSNSRFQENKPCDLIAQSKKNGKVIAIESKQIKKWQTFGMRFLRDHQIETLEAVSKKGYGFVFLNVRIQSPRENRCLVFPWKKFKQKEKYNIQELKAYPFYKGSKGRFELDGFEIGH